QDGDRAVLVEDDAVAVFEFNQAQFVVTGLAVVLRLDLRHLEHTGGGATDVERAHRQLRAGLTDGLGGDDADGFTELHLGAGGEVAAVTGHTHTVFAFAGQHGPDLDLFHARNVDGAGLEFVDFVGRTDQIFLRVLRIRDVIAGEPAHDTVGELH